MTGSPDARRVPIAPSLTRSDERIAWWGRPPAALLVVLALGVTFTTVQIVRDRRYEAKRAATAVLYVSSGEILERSALSFDTLLADIYWIRAIQAYGGGKLAAEGEKDYSLLYPLLDITTTLDPLFNVAYRFGAIFLTEAFPDGPGRPDLAVALLRKGVAANPDRWEYLQDIGFVHYWWLQDYEEAARWFRRASEVPGSSWWLQSLAANTLAQGGNREGSRLLWQQMYDSADNDWMRNEADRRLTQLDALDQIELYEQAIAVFRDRTGELPRSWQELIAAGALTGIPRDPTGTDFELEPRDGTVTVSPQSALFPLPDDPQAAAAP